MRNRKWKRALASLAGALTLTAIRADFAMVHGQEAGRALTVPAGLRDATSFQSTPIQYLPFAHFAIPFDVDRTGRLPQEVHLWVSADQGKSWLKYASNSPDKRSFEFQAAAEGEYLFAVQTQDDRGMSALAAAPPMRIMVDTTKPEIELKADINTAGRLVIDYRICDRFLSEETVQLSFAIDGRNQWEEIRVGRLQREGDVWSGQIEQEMPRCHELELKLAASDLAQNRAETVARYNAPRTAAAAAGMQLASQRAQAPARTLGQRDATVSPTTPTSSSAVQPQVTAPRAAANRVSQLAGADTRNGSQSTGSIKAGPTAASNSRTHSASPMANTQGLESSKLGLESTEGSVAWEPSSRKPNVAAAHPQDLVQQPLGKTVSHAGESPETEPNWPLSPGAFDGGARKSNSLPLPSISMTNKLDVSLGQAEELPRPSVVASEADQGLELSIGGKSDNSSALDSVLERAQPMHGSTAADSKNESVRVDIDKPLAGSALADASTSAGKTDSSVTTADRLDGEGLPTIANDAYHSRSRSFSLDYSVESLRGLPVAAIELWGTDDRGNTWLKWGSDPDRESPFDVQVGTDGLYGFRMVIVGENGLVSNRPNDGDPADMWINVDTKFPSVKITRALYGEGPDAGMLVIDYTCDDENLHDRPISLAYSERPTGPWSTIVTGLRNSGIYLWKADPNLPQQVYLRLQAVDRAGNVQEHRLDLPINLRGLTPRGRIQGFRPIDPQP